MIQGLFGKLTINAFIHDRIEASVGVSMAMITVPLIFLLTYIKDGDGSGSNGSLRSIIKRSGSCTSFFLRDVV